MSRVPRPIISNAVYFITSATHQRVRWFADPALARIVVEQWRHYEQAYEFCLYAYCVMPDHYHAVLDVGTEKSISQILHAVHSYTATLMNARLDRPRKMKVWRNRAFDEVIRKEEMFWQKIAYTLLTARQQSAVLLRRGLAADLCVAKSRRI